MREKITDWKALQDLVNKKLELSDTKGSGNVQNDGDGKGRSKLHDTWDLLMSESKYTDKLTKSVSLKKSDFYKTQESARRYGRVPFMATYQKEDKDVFVHMTLDDFARIYLNHLEYTKEEQK